MLVGMDAARRRGLEVQRPDHAARRPGDPADRVVHPVGVEVRPVLRHEDPRGDPVPQTGSRPGVAVPAGLVAGQFRAQDDRDDVVRVEVLQALALRPGNHVVRGSGDEGRVYAGGIQECPEGFENCHARLYTTKRPPIDSAP